MAGPRGETCEGCYYWAADGALGDAGEGECRKHAPRPSYRRFEDEDGNVDMSPDWPVTYAYIWCGDWKARPGEAGSCP
jgi:hypothetical protein